MDTSRIPGSSQIPGFGRGRGRVGLRDHPPTEVVRTDKLPPWTLLEWDRVGSERSTGGPQWKGAQWIGKVVSIGKGSRASGGWGRGRVGLRDHPPTEVVRTDKPVVR